MDADPDPGRGSRTAAPEAEAGGPWAILEIAPDALPAPADGYLDLVLDDDPVPPAALPPPRAAPVAAPPRPHLCPAVVRRRAPPTAVRARDVALLLGGLLAVGAIVATLGPRVHTASRPDVASVAGERHASAPPARAAPAEPRGRARRPAQRTARVAVAAPAPLEAPTVAPAEAAPPDASGRVQFFAQAAAEFTPAPAEAAPSPPAAASEPPRPRDLAAPDAE